MTKTWNFWAIVGIVLGIATGITGDIGLHYTQVALGISTGVSATICFFCLVS